MFLISTDIRRQRKSVERKRNTVGVLAQQPARLRGVRVRLPVGLRWTADWKTRQKRKPVESENRS